LARRIHYSYVTILSPVGWASVSAGRCAITTLEHSTEFIEALVPEDRVVLAARTLAVDVGLVPVGPAAGAALRLLAAAGRARSVVEIGTGTGVSGLWLLAGMRPDGVLTTIDIEGEHQRIAKRLYAEAGYAPGRTRVINGRALDVLPRLADGAYDLVFMDTEPTEYPGAVAEAQRLLRPGGALAVNGVLAAGRIGDPAAHDPYTVAMRAAVRTVLDGDEWLPALLPSSAGLLCAVKRG
jgi:predicted O-methyltransferase YrrM